MLGFDIQIVGFFAIQYSNACFYFFIKIQSIELFFLCLRIFSKPWGEGKDTVCLNIPVLY